MFAVQPGGCGEGTVRTGRASRRPAHAHTQGARLFVVVKNVDCGLPLACALLPVHDVGGEQSVVLGLNSPIPKCRPVPA
jgi:hypothetical protein